MKVFALLPYADESEVKPSPVSFDPAFITNLARRYDRWGFERVLTAQSARSPDSLPIAAHIAACTERLKLMIAHRPGFVAPTMAARMLATIDQMSGGRCGVHIITAVNDEETRCDGDFLTKEQRYHRSREYVSILRKTWAGGAPFDFEGDFYRLEKAQSMIAPVSEIPVFWGGSSGLGVQFGGECADVYALAGATLERTRSLVEGVHAAGAPFGRKPKILMSIRVVIAEDDDKAWSRAREIEATLRERSARIGLGSGSDESAARRMVEAAAARSAADPRLWGGVIEATGGRSHAMALVGGPEGLAEALRAYQAIGVDDVLLRGFDNDHDVELIGSGLIPRLA